MEPFRQLESPDRKKPTMETNLQEWADKVRQILRESGPLPLAGIARGVADATTNEVAMTVGWLACAGEICFGRRDGVCTIELQRKVPTTDALGGPSSCKAPL